ncbi:hypothetical protein KAR91_26225 [Candidatus Pacearchaeota archaeon]|nr:hypothetical protein [Candidatus Pacearchaeota archaeon]
MPDQKSTTFPDFDSPAPVKEILEGLSVLADKAQVLQESDNPYVAGIGEFLKDELERLIHDAQTFQVK